MKTVRVALAFIFFATWLWASQQKPAEESPEQKKVDKLREEAEKADGGKQAERYAELAQALIDLADRQFSAAQSVAGHQSIQQMLEAAQKAHYLAIESHNKLKQVDIKLREAERRLGNVRHTLAMEDRPTLESAEQKISALRQDIINTMFPPTRKK